MSSALVVPTSIRAAISVTLAAASLFALLAFAQSVDDPFMHSTERCLDLRREEGTHDRTISKEVGNLLRARRIARSQTPAPFQRDPKPLWPKAVDGGTSPSTAT
jgi:hypothetical protein